MKRLIPQPVVMESDSGRFCIAIARDSVMFDLTPPSVVGGAMVCISCHSDLANDCDFHSHALYVVDVLAVQ